jgi:hypothetical protein
MTSWHPSQVVLALVLATAIGTAGCGSSHGSSSGTTRLAGGFLAQLGAACRADTAGIAAAQKTVAAEAPVQRKFIQTLRTLKAPPGLKPLFATYLSLLERDLAAFEHHDVATGQRLRPQIVAVEARLHKAGVNGC